MAAAFVAAVQAVRALEVAEGSDGAAPVRGSGVGMVVVGVVVGGEGHVGCGTTGGTAGLARDEEEADGNRKEGNWRATAGDRRGGSGQNAIVSETRWKQELVGKYLRMQPTMAIASLGETVPFPSPA